MSASLGIVSNETEFAPSGNGQTVTTGINQTAPVSSGQSVSGWLQSYQPVLLIGAVLLLAYFLFSGGDED